MKNPVELWTLPDEDGAAAPGSCAEDYLRRIFREGVRVTVKTEASLWEGLFGLLKRPEEFHLEEDPEGPRRSRPDLVAIPSHWTATLAHWGLLEDITSPDLEPGSIIDALQSHCVSEGSPRVFSWPWWMEVGVLYYRKDILKQLRAQPPSSWEDFVSCCERADRSAKIRRRRDVIANGNARESVSLADVAPGIWSRGGTVLSGEGTRSLMHRPEALEGISAYLELLARGWMPLTRRRGLAARDFFDGGSIFRFSGRFRRGTGAKNPVGRSTGAVCYPRARKPAGILTARNLAVVRGSPRAGESFELLKAMTGRDASARYAEAIGAFSCRRDWDAPLAGSEMGEVFRAALGCATVLPNRVLTPTLERIFERGAEGWIRRILRGDHRRENLKGELFFVAAEMDYVLDIPRDPVSVP